MDTIGFLTKQEVDECLNDIKTFSTFTIDKKEICEIPQELHSQMVITIPGEYGIFEYGVIADLDSLFGSQPPYVNILDTFKKVTPMWFIDKYQQKNEEWEAYRETGSYHPLTKKSI